MQTPLPPLPPPPSPLNTPSTKPLNYKITLTITISATTGGFGDQAGTSHEMCAN